MTPGSGLALAQATPAEGKGSDWALRPGATMQEGRPCVPSYIPARLCCHLSRGDRAGQGNPRMTEREWPLVRGEDNARPWHASTVDRPGRGQGFATQRVVHQPAAWTAWESV